MHLQTTLQQCHKNAEFFIHMLKCFITYMVVTRGFMVKVNDVQTGALSPMAKKNNLFSFLRIVFSIFNKKFAHSSLSYRIFYTFSIGFFSLVFGSILLWKIKHTSTLLLLFSIELSIEIYVVNIV